LLTRPRLAWPFTIVPRGDGAVWLIAGEDVRFTVRAERAVEWLPDLLRACDGSRATAEIIAAAPARWRDAAREVIDDLAGERVLVDGGSEAAPQPSARTVLVEGRGALADRLRARFADAAATPDAAATADALRVVAQDDLDLRTALATGARLRTERIAWLWTTLGPLGRAYVGPLLLPDAGPCLACVLERFRLLSPVAEVYDVLVGHSGPFAPAPFPSRGVDAVAELVAWKLALVGAVPPVAAVYALHVVETATLETSSHRVFRDPECAACGT
jgi:bacteriocin biosynthesis cyclodehydratase domain-containing protein